MSDRFLYQARPPVRREFAEALYARINWEPVRNRIGFRDLAAQLRRPKVLVPFLLVLAFFAACAQKILTTNFHAAAEVAGITIYETNYLLMEPPGIDPEDLAQGSTEDFEEFRDFLDSLPPFEETLAQLSFTPQFPTWMPPGYALEPNTSFVQPFVDHCLQSNYWHQTSQTDTIFLMACEDPGFRGDVKVAPDKWEAIMLNGIPALLIRGNWDWIPVSWPVPTPEPGERYVKVFWDDKAGYTLEWNYDGVSYRLEIYTEGFSEEDFIRIAESMIPE